MEVVMMRKLVCFLTVALLAGFIAACGQTGIRNTTVRAPTNVARPERILVYDFAVSAQEVKEYQGIMRQQPTIKDAAERERLLAQEVKDALADELIEGLRSLGFRVERSKRGTPATGTDMLIDGQFLTVDEGNPLRSPRCKSTRAPMHAKSWNSPPSRIAAKCLARQPQWQQVRQCQAE